MDQTRNANEVDDMDDTPYVELWEDVSGGLTMVLWNHEDGFRAFRGLEYGSTKFDEDAANLVETGGRDWEGFEIVSEDYHLEYAQEMAEQHLADYKLVATFVDGRVLTEGEEIMGSAARIYLEAGDG